MNNLSQDNEENKYTIETTHGNTCNVVAIAEAGEALSFEKLGKEVCKTIKNEGALCLTVELRNAET